MADSDIIPAEVEILKRVGGVVPRIPLSIHGVSLGVAGWRTQSWVMPWRESPRSLLRRERNLTTPNWRVLTT